MTPHAPCVSIGQHPGTVLIAITRADLLLAVASVVVTLSFWVLPLPDGVHPEFWNRYAVATAELLALAVALIALAPYLRQPAAEEGSSDRYAAILVGAIGVGLLVRVAGGWFTEMLRIPIEPTRADMLPLIYAALDRVASGLNPYVMYYMPWPLPLSYGPWLWGLFLPAYLAGTDLRLITAFGQLFVPALAVAVAVLLARSRRYVQAIVVLALAAGVAFNPLLSAFITFGHTSAYWPLIVLFVFFLRSGATRSAAVLLGTLIVARSLFVVLVPLLALHVWQHDRRRFASSAVLGSAAVILPFLPFAVLDWRTLWFGLYGTYDKIVREYVWGQTTAALETIGFTRTLLSLGWGGHLELTSVAMLVGIYIAAWFGLRRRAAIAPWMCLALLMMCMTTLWPVWYIYLDVFVLAVAFVAFEIAPTPPDRPAAPLLIASVLTLLVMAGTLAVGEAYGPLRQAGPVPITAAP